MRNMLIILGVILLPVLAFSQVSEAGKPVKLITTDSIVGTTVLSSDTVYELNGFTYVDSGEVLIIEPGTIIKGNTGTGLSASALVIQRYAKIFAEGTPTAPIIMTSISDNVDLPLDLPDDATSKGLWGGLVLLGNASISVAGDSAFVEGIPENVRTMYGGRTTPNDNDNSGVLRYVSIRYPGSVLSPNNEINGLTLGGVGRGTVIDHVEVFYSADDDVEIFGGTVNVSHLVLAFGDDDAIDTDQGWRGVAQFVFEIKDPRWGDRLTENDGGSDATACVSCTPYARMVLTNATLIGQGTSSTAPGGRTLWKDYAGGYMYNNIFMEQPNAVMEIEVKGGDAGIDAAGSSTAWLPGSTSSIANGFPGLDFKANFFYRHDGTGSTRDSLYATGNAANPLSTARVRSAIFPGGDTSLAGKNHGDINPQLTNISWTRTGTLDPRPTGGSPAVSGAVAVEAYADPQGKVKAVSYRGAFAPGQPLWTDYWTALSFYGFTPAPPAFATWSGITDNGKPTKLITTDSLNQKVNLLSRDTVYELNGFTYLDSGKILIVEPGTVTKGNTGTGLSASALVIQRYAQIFAVGSFDFPIVMTSISDDVDLNLDLPDDATSKGLWGGLILLGNASISVAGDSAFVEGIPENVRTSYGGRTTPNDNDNSGELEYVSIRYPGSVLSPNNEINGLTLGGVGRKTRISNIEIFYSADDDVEIFGGTVNVSNVVLAFGDDDAIDTDQGWRGVAQFVFEIKDPRWGDRLTEDDGGSDATACVSCTPYARMVLTNATLIGQGTTSSAPGGRMLWKDYAGGYMYNNIFMEQPNAVMEIEVKGGDAGIDAAGSSTAWLPGSTSSIANGFPGLDFKANFFYKHDGTGTSLDSIYATGRTAAPLSTQRVRDAIFPGGTMTIAGKNHGDLDPQIRNVDWTRSEKLDPRLKVGSPAATGAVAVEAYADPQAKVVPVAYRGAFPPGQELNQTWLWKWSYLAGGKFIGTNYSTSCCTGTTGNVNMVGIVDLSDLSALVSYLTGGGYVLPCQPEANINTVGIVDLSDLSALVSYLTGGGYVLPNCL